MKEESSEARRTRLRNYECIAAAEEAVKGIFDNPDRYWKIFWETYVSKMNKLKQER